MGLINVVLVRPLYERNVGSTSRAMSNMGGHRLILIQAQCQIGWEAQQSAARGQEGLQNRTVYTNWEEFYKNEDPEGLRIAFSSRDGRARPSESITDRLDQLSSSLQKYDNIYLIFGPEDAGLSNDDLEYVHFTCSLPIYGENKSLNLSQAVLLALFLFNSHPNQTYISRKFHSDRPKFQMNSDRAQELLLNQNTPPEKILPVNSELPKNDFPKEDLEHANRGKEPPCIEDLHSVDSVPSYKSPVFPDQTLRIWLEEMGFNLSHHKINVYLILKRILLSQVPRQKELEILDLVLQQSLRKLREYNKMRKTQFLSEAGSSSCFSQNSPSQ